MKKPFLLILSLIMSLSIFASCNTKTDNSSDVSELSENEGSGYVSDASSVSDDASDTWIENVSEPDADSGPENVIYFEGTYGVFVNAETTSMGIKELFSAEGKEDVDYPADESESLTEFLANGDYGKDSYFLVGLNFSGDTKECIDYLSDIGFIADEDNMFIESNNPIAENFDSMTDLEKRREQIKRLELKLSDAYVSDYSKYARYGLPDFDTVGFITADAINSLRENKSFGTEITWFPSPDNKDLWATGFAWFCVND